MIRALVRRRHGDDGQSSLLAIPVVAGLVAFTLWVIVPLGDAVDTRTSARTAADAAALAAAETWRVELDGRLGPRMAAVRQLPTETPTATPTPSPTESEPGDPTPSPSPTSDEPEPPAALVELASALQEAQPTGAEQVAAIFAERNGARLAEPPTTRVVSDRVEFSVRTRSLEPAETTDQYLYAEATAELRLRGVCLSGGDLGVVVSGSCRSADQLLEMDLVDVVTGLETPDFDTRLTR